MVIDVAANNNAMFCLISLSVSCLFPIKSLLSVSWLLALSCLLAASCPFSVSVSFSDINCLIFLKQKYCRNVCDSNKKKWKSDM